MSVGDVIILSVWNIHTWCRVDRTRYVIRRSRDYIHRLPVSIIGLLKWNKYTPTYDLGILWGELQAYSHNIATHIFVSFNYVQSSTEHRP